MVFFNFYTIGASANVAGPQGETPLLIAARNNQEQIVQLLLLSAKNAIDLNVVDKNGWTPLFAAALNGHRAIVNMLLQGGADANKGQLDSRTQPLQPSRRTTFKYFLK